ncbi:MAG TPA: hypothetical protein VG267_20990 [Terracidiphilus sp.]|jgi:hypothetical protein|nr:hypothetical protein [Terracidiphilus sp.]
MGVHEPPFGVKPAAPFHPVEQGVNSARAKLVTVAAEFLDYAQSKNRLFGCVVQHVKAHKTDVQFLVFAASGLGAFHRLSWFRFFDHRNGVLRLAVAEESKRVRQRRKSQEQTKDQQNEGRNADPIHTHVAPAPSQLKNSPRYKPHKDCRSRHSGERAGGFPENHPVPKSRQVIGGNGDKGERTCANTRG